MMWGKHYKTMYEGSMVGSGSATFAVWGYVISHMTYYNAEEVCKVELNAKLLAFLLGDSREKIEEVIHSLCMPDPESRSKDEKGARLRRVGEYLYIVVNGRSYLNPMTAEHKKTYERLRKQEYRAKKMGTPTTNETAALEAEDAGDTKQYETLIEERRSV